MPRPYDHKFLLDLQKADPNRLGVKLGRVCVEANLPAAYVAKVLETSRTTVYSWFRGQGIREERRTRVETFIDIIEKDMKDGVLPAATIIDAKLYLRDLSGGLV
jgi:predicted transcriptional regulator